MGYLYGIRNPQYAYPAIIHAGQTRAVCQVYAVCHMYAYLAQLYKIRSTFSCTKNKKLVYFYSVCPTSARKPCGKSMLFLVTFISCKHMLFWLLEYLANTYHILILVA